MPRKPKKAETPNPSFKTRNQLETNVINTAMAYYASPDMDGDGKRLVAMLAACARLDARRKAEATKPPAKRKQKRVSSTDVGCMDGAVSEP